MSPYQLVINDKRQISDFCIARLAKRTLPPTNIAIVGGYLEDKFRRQTRC